MGSDSPSCRQPPSGQLSAWASSSVSLSRRARQQGTRARSVASHNLKRAFCSLELQTSSAPYSAFTAAGTREFAIPRATQGSSPLPHSRNTAGSWPSCPTHLAHCPHSSKAGDWAPVVNGLCCHVVIFMLWAQATSCGLHSSRSREQQLSQTGSLHHLPPSASA